MCYIKNQLMLSKITQHMGFQVHLHMESHMLYHLYMESHMLHQES